MNSNNSNAGKPSGASEPASKPARVNAGRRLADPLGYDHPWPSMRAFAELLVLRYERARTRHAYYRDKERFVPIAPGNDVAGRAFIPGADLAGH